ncbi:MAG: ribonuclease domain-containing protein [Burkholderiales bacterium]
MTPIKPQAYWFPPASIVVVLLLAMFWAVLAQSRDTSHDPQVNVEAARITLLDLPPEGRATLALIHAGGPFPYTKDGVTFGNRERRLPGRKGGYYQEYTVKTPGAHNRGARRIIAGGHGEFYYSDDHYESFRRILE